MLDLCSLPLVAQNDKGKYSVSLTNNVHVHEKTSKNITESQDRQNLKASLAKWLLEFLGIPRNKGVNFHGKFGLGIPRNS